jgi:DNA-binding CsgD family transcriptional regulator
MNAEQYLSGWKRLKNVEHETDYEKKKQREMHRFHVKKRNWLACREAQIFYYLMQGKTAIEISAMLGIQYGTITKYCDYARKRLEVETNEQVIELLHKANFINKYEEQHESLRN